MAPSSEPDADVSAWLMQFLSNTPFACTSMIRVSGGTVNFIYRGTLKDHFPSQDGTFVARTVIVKHSKAHLSGNENFSLDTGRFLYEHVMLDAMNTSFSSSSRVKIPKLYQSYSDRYLKVMEDFPNTIDVKSIMVTPSLNATLTRPIATEISRDLGSWLRSFHDWTCAPEQAELQRQISGNLPMRALKRRITYQSFIEVLEKFPESLEGHRKTLEDFKATAMAEFDEGYIEEPGEHWVIIHGDFWMGNVLCSDTSSPATKHSQQGDLVVIDWEFAQVGHRAYDLGQMIGDLYERYHLNNIDSALWLIEGFVDGYGHWSEDLAFQTAIHAGIHLLGWYNRRAPSSPLKGTPQQITDAVNMGRDFILKGWAKDKAWFEKTALASLFKMK